MFNICFLTYFPQISLGWPDFSWYYTDLQFEYDMKIAWVSKTKLLRLFYYFLFLFFTFYYYSSRSYVPTIDPLEYESFRIHAFL